MTDLQRIKIATQMLISLELAKNKEEVGKLLGYKSASSFSQVLNGKVPIPGKFIKNIKAQHADIAKLWDEDEPLNTSIPLEEIVSDSELVKNLKETIAELKDDKKSLQVDKTILQETISNLLMEKRGFRETMTHY
ncbi:hypothetical protein [Pedobacter sp. NJ-S-72]